MIIKYRLISLKNTIKQLFSYRLLLYRKGNSQYVKGSCKIGYNGYYLYLLDQDNRLLPAQIAITIVERLNQPTRAKVELFVNIDEIVRLERLSDKTP